VLTESRMGQSAFRRSGRAGMRRRASRVRACRRRAVASRTGEAGSDTVTGGRGRGTGAACRIVQKPAEVMDLQVLTEASRARARCCRFARVQMAPNPNGSARGDRQIFSEGLSHFADPSRHVFGNCEITMRFRARDPSGPDASRSRRGHPGMPGSPHRGGRPGSHWREPRLPASRSTAREP
jgi:hypothetical protein